MGRTRWTLALTFGLAGAAVAAEKAALADAAEQRNAALFRKLLDAGADVNATQVDGMTALHWAVYNDDVATARMLVRAGAKVNAANRYSVPPLSLACTNGNADLVKLLLSWRRRERDTPVARRPPDGGSRGKCRRRSRRCLPGVPTQTRVGKRQTALMWARSRAPRSCGPLIDRGADVAQSRVRITPLFFARAKVTSTWCVRPRGRRQLNETMEP